MQIEKYDVILHRLTEDKIEMLRQWRNDPKISQFMNYREYITPNMQEKWFISINNPYNFYFIIEYERKEIGLINIKNIDYSIGTGEPGIFIYNPKYLNSDVAFRASLCQGDFVFEDLNLNKTYIHIHKNNKRAILFNKAFGYTLSSEQENAENQLYFLEKSTYYKQRDYILKLF